MIVWDAFDIWIPDASLLRRSPDVVDLGLRLLPCNGDRTELF
jgi:hypothetical protein